MAEIAVRLETPADYRDVEHLTRDAFWNRYKPGCDEHLILHKMRDLPAFVKDLDLVAADATGRLVGTAVGTEARIVGSGNDEMVVLCLGPIAVTPDHQRQGIGFLLMERLLARARELGYPAVLLFGDPHYYARFGFRNAEEFGIQTSTGENFDAFMATELHDGALRNARGRFFPDPVFEADPDEVEAFDRTFPPREKEVTDTQLSKPRADREPQLGAGADDQ